MSPSLNRRRRIAIVAFWVLLVASVALVRRHPWVDAAWNALWALLAIVVVIYSVGEMFRRGRSTGEYIYSRGVPRLLWWIVYDDAAYDKLVAQSTKKTH
jgi:uncharacterized membrane protein YhaH (DUF805 family)